MHYIELDHIKVAEPLVTFINEKVLPGLEIESEAYWQQFDAIIHKHLDDNRSLLAHRDVLQ